MKRLAFLLGLVIVGILALLKNSGQKDLHSKQLQYLETDEDVWLGN